MEVGWREKVWVGWDERRKERMVWLDGMGGGVRRVGVDRMEVGREKG